MTDSTILKLVGMGLPPYSARGLKQTLEPIGAAAQLKRTINGDLNDVSDPLMRKYQSTISGTDQNSPAVGYCWPGTQLDVWSIVELSVQGTIDPTTTESGTTTDGSIGENVYGRPVVPGSVRHADGFTFFRPLLTMLVTGWNINTDEWGAVVDWTLTLEEV